jgi:hypothetical protein
MRQLASPYVEALCFDLMKLLISVSNLPKLQTFLLLSKFVASRPRNVKAGLNLQILA